MDIVEIGADASGSIVNQIAEIHSAAYSHGHFTSSFPADKLAEYNRLLIKHADISLVAIENGKVAGFAIAGRRVSLGVTEFIRRNQPFLMRKLISRPDFLLEKIIWKVRSILSPSTPSIADFRLLSIATDPAVQSKGIGSRLLSGLEERLVTRGVEHYGLSVISRNTRAIDFYRRIGFIEEKRTWDGVYFYKKSK